MENFNCENCCEGLNKNQKRFCSRSCCLHYYAKRPKRHKHFRRAKRYDWIQIQREYDNGRSLPEIRRQYGMSSGAISYAADQGYLKIDSDSRGHGKYWTKLSSERKSQICANMRLSCLNRIARVSGQPIPNFNPQACDIIEQYGIEHGYNFQHALNGGEFFIKELGYWVDGYDKERNTVIEYYESRHQTRVEKDQRRQDEIQTFLGYEFIILREGEYGTSK